MKNLKYLLVLFALYSTSSFAYKVITLNGSNRSYKCSFRKTLLTGLNRPRTFVRSIKKLNLSVNCLHKSQRKFIERTDLPVRGVVFGTHGSVSHVVSVEGGVELVLTVHDRDSLMIGLVGFAGGGASVGLPGGVSITRGAIHGKCQDLANYLGNFQNFSFLGMNKSFGTADEWSDPHRTHCDSSSNTVGASTSLIGYSMTHYTAASKFYILKGERVEELIDYITRYHPLGR